MTEEKWIKIYGEEADKVNANYIRVTPSNWAEVKGQLVTFIKTVDEATEVYSMENNNGKT